MKGRASPEKTRPYQCEIPVPLYERVMGKFKASGVTVAPFVRQLFEDLDKRPVAESVRRLRPQKGE